MSRSVFATFEIAAACATSGLFSGVTGYPSDATENAVQPNIVAAGYGKSHGAMLALVARRIGDATKSATSIVTNI
jgi:hypothetical protein